MLNTIMTALAHRFARPRRRSGWLVGCMLGALLLLPLALAACNDAPSNDVALNQLKWCGKQTLVFQDASQTPPAPLTDWKQVKKALDFTVYLPPQLPKGTCLVSGEALVHDKVLGSSFGVSYMLPNGVPLAFSETAQSNGEAVPFQCSPSNAQPTTTPTQAAEDTPTPSDNETATPTPPAPTPTATTAVSLLCLGGKGKTSVVMGSSASEKTLKDYFQNLQADVDWIPQK